LSRRIFEQCPKAAPWGETISTDFVPIKASVTRDLQRAELGQGFLGSDLAENGEFRSTKKLRKDVAILGLQCGQRRCPPTRQWEKNGSERPSRTVFEIMLAE